MKLYISTDMEGSTGVVSSAQVDHRTPLYQFGRSMQCHDLMTVVRAAFRWGVDSIIVNDAHWTMTNITYSDCEFPDGVELISGTPKMLGMVEGAGDADAAFFLGYHAMAGTEKAVLDHSYSATVVFDLKVNGQKLGETGLNALFCGALGVPVAMVSGDQALCLEAGSILGPELVTCQVKEGLGRFTAQTLTPEATAVLLADACKRALDKAAAGKSPSLVFRPPYRIELTCHTSAQADIASLVPGTERTSGRTVIAEAEDVLELRRYLCSWVDCASTVEFE